MRMRKRNNGSEEIIRETMDLQETGSDLKCLPMWSEVELMRKRKRNPAMHSRFFYNYKDKENIKKC